MPLPYVVVFVKGGQPPAAEQEGAGGAAPGCTNPGIFTVQPPPFEQGGGGSAAPGCTNPGTFTGQPPPLEQGAGPPS